MKTCLIASAVAGALVVVAGLLWMRAGGGALLSAAEWNSRRAGEVPPTLVVPPVRPPSPPLVAATVPVGVPSSAVAAGSAGDVRAVDRYAHAEVLMTEAVVRAPGRRSMVRLLRVAAKYPLVRVEEDQRWSDATGAWTLERQTAMVGDHVIVKLRPGRTRDELAVRAGREGGAHIRRALHSDDTYLVACGTARLDGVPELVNGLRQATGLVAVVEPDMLVRPAAVPNDLLYNHQWHHPKIDMPNVWNFATGRGNVVVAVIDTGVDYAHPELTGNIWVNPGEIPGNGIDDDGNGFIDDVNGWDFDEDDNAPTDAQSHGTHVAGIVGAVGNNGNGVAGICWNVRVMPLRFIGDDGSGATSDAIDAMNYVILMRRRGVNLRVVNASWGGAGASETLRQAIATSAEEGVLFVAAAGNDNRDNDIIGHYPSNYDSPNIVAVANTDQIDGRRASSNYGAATVDLGAPGTDIYSLYPGVYGYKTGTSMAAPVVAGVAALLWDYLPSLTVQEVKTAILDGVDPVASMAGITVTGGRLNAYGAFLALEPRLEHTPLVNTTNTVAAYTIEASVDPADLIGPGGLVVCWNTNGLGSPFFTNALERVADNVFRGAIPALPLDTTVYYSLRAETLGGRVVSHPAAAPAALHVFSVVMAQALTIHGSPTPLGVVVPPYGAHHVPYANEIVATAPAAVDEVNGQRYACIGWAGTGSIPPFGASNRVAFVIQTPSVLEWHWQHQYELTVRDSLTTAMASTWWPAGGLAATPLAAESMAWGGTTYRFTEWRVDGVRLPSAYAAASNPATDISMSGPRTAIAIYVREDLDSDGNLLPDWWERRHFGQTGTPPNGDFDADGAVNRLEYLDGTDPRERTDYPRAPTIGHEPLPDPQRTPSPWKIEAVIEDNHAVAYARLEWQRNGGEWRTTAMDGVTGNVYQGVIPSPHALGDSYLYRVVAGDRAGMTVQSPSYAFTVRYPRMAIAPTNIVARLAAGAYTNLALAVTNVGNATLDWVCVPGWVETFDTADARPFTTGGQNNYWGKTSYRSRSGALAWYCGRPPYQQYVDSMNAWLRTPPVRLDAGARLTFDHWARMEYDDEQKDDHYWDGGIVEISTNGGASFVQITPVGGYPHRITENDDSPFAPETPCFGGNGGWTNACFDLDAYAGQVVQVQFRFGSDKYTVDEGWYIDNVAFESVHLQQEGWMTTERVASSIEPNATGRVALALAATNLNSGTRWARLRVRSNDPEREVVDIPVQLVVRTAPTLVLEGAEQAVTNGSGRVAIRVRVADMDGDDCALRLEYSPDGQAWTALWVASAAAQHGTPLVNNEAFARVSAVATRASSVLVTNAVRVDWSSQDSPAVALDPAARVRVTAWDGVAWSAAVTSAPFMVDNLPPDASDAFVTFPVSRYGRYQIGPRLDCAWGGFADTGVGLAGYFVGLADRGGTPEGVLSFATNAVLSDVPLDREIPVYVWARDAVGNIGAAVSGTVLVLHAERDFDGDGLVNADEEISGTAADDGTSVLRLGSSRDGAGTNTFVLAWPTVADRFYSIFSATGAVGSFGPWRPVAGGASNAPGTGGIMTYTGRVDQVPAVFYRVSVSD